jgi:hypothetical protein
MKSTTDNSGAVQLRIAGSCISGKYSCEWITACITPGGTTVGTR